MDVCPMQIGYAPLPWGPAQENTTVRKALTVATTVKPTTTESGR